MDALTQPSQLTWKIPPKCSFPEWEKEEVHSLGVSEIAADEMRFDSSVPAALSDFKCQEPDRTCGGGMGCGVGGGGGGGGACSTVGGSVAPCLNSPSSPRWRTLSLDIFKWCCSQHFHEQMVGLNISMWRHRHSNKCWGCFKYVHVEPFQDRIVRTSTEISGATSIERSALWTFQERLVHQAALIGLLFPTCVIPMPMLRANAELFLWFCPLPGQNGYMHMDMCWNYKDTVHCKNTL